MVDGTVNFVKTHGEVKEEKGFGRSPGKERVVNASLEREKTQTGH